MSIFLGTLSIKNGVNAQFQTPITGLKAIRIGNLSGLSCKVTLDGGNISKNLYPGTVDWFPVTSNYTGTIIIVPSAILTNTSWWAASNLQFDGIGNNDTEDGSSYPINLTVPAVTPTASGKAIFCANITFAPATTLTQKLNVFNPATSGVKMIFHAAKVFTSDVTAGNLASMNNLPGADLNLGTPVGTATHNLFGTFPTSVAHVTAEDATTARSGNLMEIQPTVGGNTMDFLAFPDQVILGPGNNLRIAMVEKTGGTAPTLVALTLKWTEESFS